MAGTKTKPGVDRRPLIAYLRVQRATEREMLTLLQSASAKIDSELRRLSARTGIGAAVRRDQIALSQAALHREMSSMWSAIGDVVEAGRADAAAAAVMSTYPLSALKSVLPADDVDFLLRSAQETARRGAATVEARVRLSQIPLAQSVYRNTELANGTIDKIVNDALARGASASELARDVKAYIRPDVRGGVSYSAKRLGRTELNNAFHAQQVEEGIKQPWVTAVRWNLSGSHPRPDECNEYAEDEHFEGGGAGVWKPEEIPGKPHPNCLCFTTPEVDSRDEFIRKFQAGEYDDYLDAEFPDLSVRPKVPRISDSKRSLKEAIESGEKSVTRLAKPDKFTGADSTSELVTFNNGTKAIRKVSPSNQAVLSQRVGDAINSPIARSVVDSNGRLVSEFVDGEMAMDVAEVIGLGFTNGVKHTQLIDTDSGRMLGIFDHLTMQGDRHAANWFVRDGEVVGIDHDDAFNLTGASPFASRWSGVDVSGALDLDVMVDSLSALEPEFRALGQGGWFEALMERARHLRDNGSFDHKSGIPFKFTEAG